MTAKTYVAGLMVALSRRVAAEGLTTPPVPAKPEKVKPPPPTSKVCTKCGQEKPIEQYKFVNGRACGLRRSECRDCYNTARRARHARRALEGRPATSRAWRRESMRKWRERSITALGGACRCCGETDIRFLAIDHVNNDGAYERRELKLTSFKFYYYLKRVGYPRDRYQLLCHNCNMTKQFYGACPHVEQQISIVKLAAAMIPQFSS